MEARNNQRGPDLDGWERSAPAFAQLVSAAQACRECPSMDGRRRVISALNGRPDAGVMVIAEAPGRFGGEMTGQPLVDDASGRHFTALLAQAGIRREDLFITNAILCNPQDPHGRNRRPSAAELANCRRWLSLQIATIDPAVILTLGAVALGALATIEAHSLRLHSHAGRPFRWANRTVIPLYHPSPLTRASRTDASQLEDFRAAAAYLRKRGLITDPTLD
jgi:uracil-DNA glycosylase family 4